MNRRVRWAEAGGYLIALAGVLAVIAIAAAAGTPFVVAVVGMILGLAPVMLGFYELGGRTPLVLARAALTIGILAVVGAAGTLLAGAAGLVTIDESRAATGALAVLAVSMIAYGGWIAGACVLAGSWLTARYQLLYPIWGLVIGRRFAAVRADQGA